jgi:hypothetical protein
MDLNQLLAEWILSDDYQLALRQVTAYARGKLHLAEDAIHDRLVRMLANPGMYHHFDMNRLTSFIVTGAYFFVWNKFNRDKGKWHPMPDSFDGMANVRQPEAFICAEERELFDQVGGCLHEMYRRNANHALAVIYRLETSYSIVQLSSAWAFFSRELLNQWITERTVPDPGTGRRILMEAARKDLERGRRLLRQCLWQRGWEVDRLIDFP